MIVTGWRRSLVFIGILFPITDPVTFMAGYRNNCVICRWTISWRKLLEEVLVIIFSQLCRLSTFGHEYSRRKGWKMRLQNHLHTGSNKSPNQGLLKVWNSRYQGCVDILYSGLNTPCRRKKVWKWDKQDLPSKIPKNLLKFYILSWISQKKKVWKWGNQDHLPTGTNKLAAIACYKFDNHVTKTVLTV